MNQLFSSSFSKRIARIIIAGLLTVFINNAVAQPEPRFLGSKNKKAQSLFEDGYREANRGQVDEAIAHFQKAVEKDPEFVDAYMMLAQLYENQGKQDEAIRQYEAAIKARPDYGKAYYYLANSYFRAQRYKEAKAYYTTFLESSGTKAEFMVKTTNERLKVCEFAIPYVENPVPFKPENMGPNINSQLNEYFPNITADDESFVFTRRVGADDEDIYISHGSAGGWSPAASIGSPINTPGKEGAVAISPDGQYIFFAADYPGRGLGRFDIYMSRRTANGWSAPENIGAPVNSGDWDTQPCFSSDGHTLYFVSKRPGGLGGSDIWMSSFENGKFGEPVNLGANINTPGEDQCPFLHYDNQTLYFSSNGHMGFGDADLFISRRQADGSWGKAENIGFPINGPGKEMSLLVSRNGKKAFFASDRLQGLGGLDIYTFDLHPGAQPQEISYVKGIVTDKSNGQKLAAEVELINLENAQTAAKVLSNPNTGEYLVILASNTDYALNVNRSGYLFYSENFSLKENPSDEPFRRDVALNPIKVGEQVVLRNIFFDIDQATLKATSQAELGKLIAFLKENPSARIEISGHTDNTGTKAHNQTLSQNRAKAVYDYLVSKGMDKTRLTFKGYADNQPLAPNDSEANKALNRRTEFKIIGL